MKKFSNNRYLPRIYFKYLWLLGQFIQHSLLYLQGVRVPEPPELKEQFPDKNPAELINLHREIYGCKFDWKTGALVVSYQESQFEVTAEAEKIVSRTINPDIIACCSFDDRGFDFNTACNEAVKDIIEVIKSGEMEPL